MNYKPDLSMSFIDKRIDRDVRAHEVMDMIDIEPNTVRLEYRNIPFHRVIPNFVCITPCIVFYLLTRN